MGHREVQCRGLCMGHREVQYRGLSDQAWLIRCINLLLLFLFWGYVRVPTEVQVGYKYSIKHAYSISGDWADTICHKRANLLGVGGGAVDICRLK